MKDWNINGETKRPTEPPKTKHEIEASKDAMKKVEKELREKAEERYAKLLREAVEAERDNRKETKRINELLKNAGATREELDKLL